LRLLAERGGLLLELLQLALGDAAELEQQAAGGRRLARVDVAADDDGKVRLGLSHFV